VSYARTGPWTDVHALGLLMTELLTDEPPFSAPQGKDEQLFEQIMSADRPTPARRGVDAGGLETVVARALALSPGQRWRDAGQMLQALHGKTGRSPARRRRPAAFVRLQRRLTAAAATFMAAPPWRKVRAAW